LRHFFSVLHFREGGQQNVVAVPERRNLKYGPGCNVVDLG
jgi:hypothetical protein